VLLAAANALPPRGGTSLDADAIAQIRATWEAGHTSKLALARAYDVSNVWVTRILEGQDATPAVDEARIAYALVGTYLLDAFWRIADRIKDDGTYWSCLRGTWTGDDAPGLGNRLWQGLWTARGHRELVMLPEERVTLAALPDPLRIYRGTVREVGQGMSWTTDPVRAAWFARCNQDNLRIRALYGVLAQGTPVVLEGLIARGEIFAYLAERGEEEVVAPYEAVMIERVLPWEDAAALWDPDYSAGAWESTSGETSREEA
jgi:hypothetical protein